MPSAVVISGGGSRGAFAVGVLERLRSRGVSFDMVAGSSTGALIAPLVVTDEIQLLRAIYTGIRTEDILRQREPLEILLRDAIYDSTPLWSLINTFLNEERYRLIIASPMDMFITTVNLQTGQIERWNQHQSGPDGGVMDRRTLLRAVFASASIPVLMPPVQIRDGDQYVDGGIREITPLKVAIDAGATDIYAIVLAPLPRGRVEESYVFIVKTLLRTIDLMLQEVLHNDIERAILYNRAIRHLTLLRQKAEALLSPEQVATLFDDPENPNPFADKRLLNLYIIRPEEELPGEVLEFSPIIMAQMMELGVQAAERALDQGPIRFT